MYEIRSSRRPVIRCPDFDTAYMTARGHALRDRLQATILRRTPQGAIEPALVLTPRAFGFEAHECPWQSNPTGLKAQKRQVPINQTCQAELPGPAGYHPCEKPAITIAIPTPNGLRQPRVQIRRLCLEHLAEAAREEAWGCISPREP